MITFKQYLFESTIQEMFDSPHSIKERDDQIGEMIHGFAPTEVKHVKAYQIGDTDDSMFTWHHDGAMEIHHLPGDFQVGHMKESDKPNPRFISTAMKLGRDHLASGGKIRIVTTDALLPHFEPLGNKISKRYGYKMETHPIKDTSFYAPFPIKLHAIEVQKDEK